MPKRNAARGEQRNKPRTQKHFELVRPAQEESQPAESETAETGATGIATSETEENTRPAVQEKKPGSAVAATARSSGASRRARSRSSHAVPTLALPKEEVAAPEPVAVEESGGEAVNGTETLPKGSAAARIAARRQASQKTQQRTATALITPEHYAYVRRDLLYIAILALIMFSVIIILHFVPGIGF